MVGIYKCNIGVVVDIYRVSTGVVFRKRTSILGSFVV